MFDFSYHIAQAAHQSLILEVRTTPKPGLVDQNNTGSHKDMDLPLFLKSADALQLYFLECAQIGIHYQDRPEHMLSFLRPLGMRAEQDMYQATCQVNTHKGAIFSMGIFCAVAGYLHQHGQKKDSVHYFSDFSDTCRRICGHLMDDFKHISALSPRTNGEQLYLLHKITGIRGEAALGFPSVFRIGFPAYKKYCREGLSSLDAGACTLLHLIAVAEDTNIISRSSYETYLAIRQALASYLRTASASEILSVLPEMDQIFISRNISPGGCADMLALIYFLDLL